MNTWKERQAQKQTEFNIAQATDAYIVASHLSGADISGCPLYIKTDQGPRLTYAGALLTANQLGIERISEESTPSKRFYTSMHKPFYFATVIVKLGNLTRAGASQSGHRQVAIELAARNAIQQIISHSDITRGI